MNIRLLLICLLLSAPLRAAEAPARLLTAIGPALKGVRSGPAAIVAKNLLALDPLLAQGSAGEITRRILEPVMRALEDKGFDGMNPKSRRAAIPRALVSHAQSVNDRADPLIESAAKELLKGQDPDRNTFESAEALLMHSHPFLSADRNQDLRDISSDAASRAAFLARRRQIMADRAGDAARRLVRELLPFWEKGRRAPCRFIIKEPALQPPPGARDSYGGPNLWGC